MGILQALCATGAITYASAIPIIMGQNIGTCVTALLSSRGREQERPPRSPWSHLYFNIIGVMVFLAGLYGLNAVVHFDFVNETIAGWALPSCALPSTSQPRSSCSPLRMFWKGSGCRPTIPRRPRKRASPCWTIRLLNTPAVAVARARSAAADMHRPCRVGVMQAMSLTHTWDDTLAQKVRDEESKVDQYEDALGTYLVKLSSRELNHAEQAKERRIACSTRSAISSASVTIPVNLLESCHGKSHTKEIDFSADAREELQVLRGRRAGIVLKPHHRRLPQGRPASGEQGGAYGGTVVDELVRAIQARHVARLQAGSCSIEYGFVLEESRSTNYERVCDHCSNVAVAQIEVAQDSFDTHAYLNDLRSGHASHQGERAVPAPL